MKDKIFIELEEFINSNLKILKKDIECEFMSFGKRGLRANLFKLSKVENLSLKESLNVLLGRTACIWEGWNYKEVERATWEYMYKPTGIMYTPNHFIQTPIEDFYQRYNGYLNALKDDVNMQTVTKNFKFNGDNLKEIYKPENALPIEQLSNLNPLKDKTITKCYSCREIWHSEKWYLESKECYYFYVEDIYD